MPISRLSKVLAAATAAAIATGVIAASASADESTPSVTPSPSVTPEPSVTPVPEATLTLSSIDVLTLPAGDGVRDEASLMVSSDIPTTVEVTLRPFAGGAILADYGSIDLAGSNDPITIDFSLADLPVAGLGAGSYTVEITTADGGDETASLIVGSGDPTYVGLWLSEDTLFSWSGSTPHSAEAEVWASDETELQVPFTGSVTAVVGGKSVTVPVTSTDGYDAFETISATGLGAGIGSATATVHGPSNVDASSAAVPLTVAQTAVTSVAVSRAVSTVYPAKDSYRDTVKITVSPKTTTDSTFAATGSVKITRSGKTVKTWALTSSKASSFTWDGRVSGKVVPGTYTVTVAIKGPEGSTRTATTTIKVDSGKLVSKTKTITYKAKSAFKKYANLGYSGPNLCYNDYPRANYIYCYAKYAAADSGYALVGLGTLTVPSYVVSAEHYGSAKVTTTLYNVAKTGTIDWFVGADTGSSRAGTLKSGTNSLGSASLPTDNKKVYLYLGLDRGEKVSLGSVKVTYTYRVMTH